MDIATAQPNRLRGRIARWISESPPVRYPDLGLMCLGIFIMLIGVGAVVPVRSIYARNQGATMVELGLMASAFLLGQFLSQMPGGWASDKWGRKPLLVGGIAISGVISYLFLLYDYPWYFIALRFVEGAASGAINPAANAYVMDAVPPKERGAAYGWLGSAFSAGLMLGPAAGGLMVDTLGFASPFIFGGSTSLLTALFLARKMRDRKPGAEPLEVAPAEARENTRVRGHIPRSLFAPALAGALVLIIASGFGDGLFISIWSIWLNDLHASNSFIGLTFITFSLPLMVLMPITGKLADRMRLAPLIALPGIAISFIYLFYGLATNLALIAAMGIIEGSLVAMMAPALSAYIAQLSPDNARGKLQGVISTVRTIAGFASSMLVALLYGANMSYPFIMLAIVQVVVSIVGGLIIWRVERRTAHLARTQKAEVAGSASLLESAADKGPVRNTS